MGGLPDTRNPRAWKAQPQSPDSARRAADIARALRGRRCGDGGWLCRCPVGSHGKGDGDHHPSLSIRDGETALLVRCFAGCDPRDVLDELRRRGLIEGEDRSRPHRQPTQRIVAIPEPEPDAEALALWRASEPLTGTLAERYLREYRGIEIELPESLRFLPEAFHPRAAICLPALIAAVSRPDGKIVACQVLFLRPSDGQKASVATPRLTVGRLGGGAVRLGEAGDVLGLAEGVESALSAQQLAGVPCWATLGAHRLGGVKLPRGLREVHLFADDDDAGRLGAEKAAAVYTRNGLRVTLRWPPVGHTDWNDLVGGAAA